MANLRLRSHIRIFVQFHAALMFMLNFRFVIFLCYANLMTMGVDTYYLGKTQFVQIKRCTHDVWLLAS